MLNTVGYGVILLTEFAGGLKWIGVFEQRNLLTEKEQYAT
jgi:hypothetical protein